MAAVTICSDFGAQETKVSHCFRCFPICLPSSDRTGCHNLGFFECWVLSQLYYFPLFTFIKRLFSSSSLSGIKVMLSAYLRLLIFLPTNLIPACASSSPAFCRMYSAYKLNKQDDNLQTWRTPFPLWMVHYFMSCMKRQKDMTPGDEPLRSESVQYALG